MRFAIRGTAAALMVSWICGCGVSNVAIRSTPAHSPLRLELATTDAEVRAGAHVTVHVRLWNLSLAPIHNVDIALSHAPSLIPAGGTGSTLVRKYDGSALHIERVARLDPGGLAEWWLVLRAGPSADASLRVMAVLGTAEDASFETVHWRVVDMRMPDVTEHDDDPEAIARTFIALSREHRASGRDRDELHALYAARVFIDQSAPERVAEETRADIADRARELYLREYGDGEAPLVQDPLPRTSILAGVVVDKATQSPVADAAITLRSTLSEATYATTITGADGTFQITGLGVEPVMIVAEMPGYRATVRSGFELCPDAITRLVTELEPDNPAARRYAVESRDLAELHGTLSGYRGDGTRNVQVILSGADTREALTDEQGRFQFTGVTPGDYTFVAVKPGFAAIERRALSVTPGDVVEVQFTLEPEP